MGGLRSPPFPLRRVAKGADIGFNCRGDAAPSRTVRPTVRAMLELLEPAASVLMNRLNDLLAWTTGFEQLMRPAGLLRGTPPNLARYVFTDPRARAAYPDWDRAADEQVAALKYGPFRADPHVAALADELSVTAGDEFASRLETVPGAPAASGLTRLAHPAAGELRLAFETLDLPADDDLRLVVYLPADAATSAALDRLVRSGPRSLGVVSG